MQRREFVEMAGLSTLGWANVPASIESVTEHRVVDLMATLPREPGEYSVRVMDDSFETTGQWVGNVDAWFSMVEGGDIEVRSAHAFVTAKSPSTKISESFTWSDEISMVIVDFQREDIELIYGGSERETYWRNRKEFDKHRRRMMQLMDRARKRGDEVDDSDLWEAAKSSRDKMHESAKKGMQVLDKMI